MDTKNHYELLSLRPEEGKDEAFLRQLYASTRAEEMAMTGWEQQQINEFLNMQFDLQHKQYVQNYLGARFDIILMDKDRAGRLYVQRGKAEMRIIDIALLPKFRRLGIGSKLMSDLITEANEKQLPLSLHVEYNNPALGLYERLGFIKGELRGVYYYMERPPDTHDS